MGRWLTLYRDLTTSWPSTDNDPGRRRGASVIDDFLARSPVRRDSSLFAIEGELRFSDISSLTEVERNAATLARWILKEHPNEVHVRALLRKGRLPGLRSAGQIKAAAKILVEANWLRAPVIGFGAQRKVAYAVNPRLWARR